MLIRMVVPLLRYRRLIWQHAVADLHHRYAGTGLGVVWNVLHPLALIVIYSVVFSVILKGKAYGPDGRPIPYPLTSVPACSRGWHSLNASPAGQARFARTPPTLRSYRSRNKSSSPRPRHRRLWGWGLAFQCC